jgi:hypothetical protein
MNGAILPLPQYPFMAWCLVKAEEQLYNLLYTFSFLILVTGVGTRSFGDDGINLIQTANKNNKSDQKIYQYTARHEGVLGSGDIAPAFFDLGTRWR